MIHHSDTRTYYTRLSSQRRMANAWIHSTKAPRTDGLVTSYQSLPHTGRQCQACIKTKLSLLMKRMLNMSKCSQSSRSLLVQMRDRLKVALEREGIAPPESPNSPQTGCAIPEAAHSSTSRSATTTCKRAEQTTKIQANSTRSSAHTNLSLRHLDCAYCIGFMVQPVCLPCGHSVCKSCLDKTMVGGGGDGAGAVDGQPLACPCCGHTFPIVPLGFSSSSSSSASQRRSNSGTNNAGGNGRRPTVILQNALQKWYPNWVESGKHKDEGNVFANEGDFPMAVHWYSQALQTGALDHRVLGNRSRAYLAMDRLDEALQDAETACQLRPFWPKGHFRRAAVLVKQERWQEALAAYLLCLHLGGNDQSVVKTACQLLDKKMPLLLPKVEPDKMDTSEEGSKSHSNSSPGGIVDAIVQLCIDVMLQCLGARNMDTGNYEWEQQQGNLIPQHLVRGIDFECVLCTGLLFCPITTPCGHSFCQSCLSRAFDHSPYCPICRASLAERFQQHHQQTGRMNEDIVLRNVLIRHFLEAYEEKRAQVMAETQLKLRIGVSETEELPIFVCTMAYPGMPCPLHIFEPRYRLMMRRCVNGGSRRFGMCQPAVEEGSDNISFSDYGTVLFINSVEYTPDGRSLITTTGERRFNVIGRSMKDGYNCARIRFVYDESVTDPMEIGFLRALQVEVYEHARKWLNALPHYTRLMIAQMLCSPLPPIEETPENCPNGPMWVWWYVHALPTTPTRKIEFLKCTLLQTRLQMLKESLPVPT